MYDIEQIRYTYKQLTDDIKSDLDKEYKSGRLKGTDYANVYVNLMNTAMQLAFESPIKEQQVMEIKSRRALNDAQSVVQIETATKVARETSLVQSQIEKNNVERDFEIKKMKDLLPEQIKKEKADISLILRQIKNLDDQLLISLLSTQLNAWSVMFNSGLLEAEPGIIKNDEVTSLYNTIKDNINK